MTGTETMESQEIIEAIEWRGNTESIEIQEVSMEAIQEAIDTVVRYVAFEDESESQLRDRPNDRQCPYGIHTILDRLVELLVAKRISLHSTR